MYLNFVWFLVVVVVGFKSLRFKLGLVNFLNFFHTDAQSLSLTLAPAQAVDARLYVCAARSR